MRGKRFLQVFHPEPVRVEGDQRRALDPDVKNVSAVPVQVGSRLTLIGLVRAMPPEETAIRQWALDPGTAKTAREHGTYLHVTEIRPE